MSEWLSFKKIEKLEKDRIVCFWKSFLRYEFAKFVGLKCHRENNIFKKMDPFTVDHLGTIDKNGNSNLWGLIFIR